MPVYARVVSGLVIEIIDIKGNEPKLEERYHSDILHEFIELRGNLKQHVAPGWLYDGASFHQKPSPAPTPPEDAEEDEIPEGVKIISLQLLKRRLKSQNLWGEFAKEVHSRPVVFMDILFSNGRVRTDNQQLRDLITAIGGNANRLLRVGAQ